MSGAASAHKPASLVQFDVGLVAGVVSLYGRAEGGGPSSDESLSLKTPCVESGLNKSTRRVKSTLRAHHLRIRSISREVSRTYQRDCQFDIQYHAFLQKRWTTSCHGTGCCNADTPHARRHAFITRKYYFQQLTDTPHEHADTLATTPR